ncbi:MAG: GC-type dockerin domain-anchored protein [Phycisphaerales bacterium JB039]
MRLRTSARARPLALLAGCAIVTSAGLIACDQEATIKGQVMGELAAHGFIGTKVSVKSARTSGKFTYRDEVVYVECEVTVSGFAGQPPVPATRTVKTRLEAKGSPPNEYDLDCSDPLILQLPDDATGVVATASDAGGPILLPLKAGLASVPILPGVALDAEPGTQLVVIEYPAGMAPGIYDLALDFDLSFSRPIEVKALITGKVTCGGETYLPPIVPNVTHMADVPPVIIPVSPTPVDILPDITMAKDVDIRIDCGGCYADCDADGTLDIFDFLCFQNAFTTKDRYADCDGDGTWDIFDFLCFQNEFTAGCS